MTKAVDAIITMPADGNLKSGTAIDACVRFEFIICVVIIGSLSVLGMGGNVASFIVLCRHRTETATVMLLRVLAVSDSVLLFTSLFVYTLPALFSYAGTLPIFSQEWFVVRSYVWPLALMAHTITVWVTVLVTIHRYCSICRALSTSRILYAVRATKLQIIAVVSFSILYNMPRFFEHHVISHGEAFTNFTTTNTTNNGTDYLVTSPPVTQPPINLGDSQLYQIVYSNVLYFPVMYILPLVILTFLNFRLMKAMNGLRARKQTLTGHKAKDDHVTLIVIVIVIVFIINQTPALVNQIFWAILPQSDRSCGKFHYYYTRISDVLVVFNSSVNFIIYCLFGKTFRMIFINSFCHNTSYVFSMSTIRKHSTTVRDARSNAHHKKNEAVTLGVPDCNDEPTNLLSVPTMVYSPSVTMSIEWVVSEFGLSMPWVLCKYWHLDIILRMFKFPLAYILSNDAGRNPQSVSYCLRNFDMPFSSRNGIHLLVAHRSNVKLRGSIKPQTIDLSVLSLTKLTAGFTIFG